MNVETGVIHRFSREEYDRLERANWSSLKHIARSPAHYQYNRLSKQADTDAKKLGRGTHLAVLEPERFAAQCAVWTEGRRFGKKWDAFCAKNEGREILKEDDLDRCLAIQRAVRADATAKKYLKGGRAELSVFWTHRAKEMGGLPGFGLDCKARIDFAGQAALVDLKGTRNASPDGFARESWNYRYHTQAALYRDGYEAATGARLPYVIVAVENTAPYLVQVYRVPESILEIGREEYRDLLARLHYCRTNATWPGYADGESELTLPKWAVGYVDDDITGLDLQIQPEAGESA